MVVRRAVFDTNILVDLTKGLPAAAVELARYEVRAISLITWIEFMAGGPEHMLGALHEFLGEFVILPVTKQVAEEAVKVRRRLRVKLPDAIILATARTEGWLFVTRNTRDFVASEDIRIPYTL